MPSDEDLAKTGPREGQSGVGVVGGESVEGRVHYGAVRSCFERGKGVQMRTVEMGIMI